MNRNLTELDAYGHQLRLLKVSFSNFSYSQ